MQTKAPSLNLSRYKSVDKSGNNANQDLRIQPDIAFEDSLAWPIPDLTLAKFH